MSRQHLKMLCVAILVSFFNICIVNIAESASKAGALDESTSKSIEITISNPKPQSTISSIRRFEGAIFSINAKAVSVRISDEFAAIAWSGTSWVNDTAEPALWLPATISGGKWFFDQLPSTPELFKSQQLTVQVRATLDNGSSVSVVASYPVKPSKLQEYTCGPTAKYDCLFEKCDRETEGFAHAESFEYNSRTHLLRACLWTNCYEGKATVFTGEAETITAAGKLRPVNPGNYYPFTVSLTIDQNNSFTAVWLYEGNRIVFDMGTCNGQPR